MKYYKLAASFLVPIGVAFSIYNPNSSALVKGLALTNTILFCTATAIETFTQD